MLLLARLKPCQQEENEDMRQTEKRSSLMVSISIFYVFSGLVLAYAILFVFIGLALASDKFFLCLAAQHQLILIVLFRISFCILCASGLALDYANLCMHLVVQCQLMQIFLCVYQVSISFRYFLFVFSSLALAPSNFVKVTPTDIY